MISRNIFFLFIIILLPFSMFAQSDSIEVYLIDAYCTREMPYTFKLSFYTSEECRSKVALDDEYEFDISTELTDFHKKDIDINNLSFAGKIVYFVIETETESEQVYKSEKFDFDLPFEPEIESGSDLFTLCLFGSVIFLLPYPSYAFDSNSSYFSLTKEIPFISFRSKNMNYPAGYLSVEYSYLFQFLLNRERDC